LAFLNPGLIDLLSCSRSLPPSQPRIKELWFVHEPQNLEIYLTEVGDFQMIVLPFGVWVIGVAPRRVRKINSSIEVRTSKVRVLPFGLSCWWAPE
jgi:hypothetical protein